jgi:hypothetical protein
LLQYVYIIANWEILVKKNPAERRVLKVLLKYYIMLDVFFWLGQTRWSRTIESNCVESWKSDHPVLRELQNAPGIDPRYLWQQNHSSTVCGQHCQDQTLSKV